MTINCSCLSSDGSRSRLPFGVPLEDIFPQNDIHPYLRGIFIRAFKDITTYGYSIDKVISKLQGNIAERLVLKEIVVTCKPMPTAIPPGAFLWIIRHFIGLLPLPLLPEYSDQKHFSWRRLAQFCRRSFLKYATVEVNNRLLTQKLAEELLRLPAANLLLVSVLLNFVRLLSYRPQSRGRLKLNRLTAFCLVRYFSSSIFIRPYTPGRNSKIDRTYAPLLLYLVFKWSDIEKYFKSNVISTINITDTPRELLESPQITCASLRTIKIKDSCSQTEKYESKNDWEIIPEEITEDIDLIESDEYHNELSEITSSMRSYGKTNKQPAYESDGLETIIEEVDFLRDTGSQTEPLWWKYQSLRCCCLHGSHYESNLSQDESGDKSCSRKLIGESSDEDLKLPDSKLSEKCSQTDFHKESPIKTERDINEVAPGNIQCLNEIAEMKTCLKKDVGTITDNLPYFGWVSPRVSRKNTLKHALISPQTFISDNEYIYDDYGGSSLNLLGNIDDDRKDIDSDLMSKISKIGWTYTPPKTSSANSPLLSPFSVSKTGLKEQNYTLYYSKEQLNKEDKENCSSSESGKSKSSVKSKKSFSVANIRNKLHFLKFFTGKKNKLKNSCSFDEISNVKYKKMNSAKSTLF